MLRNRKHETSVQLIIQFNDLESLYISNGSSFDTLKEAYTNNQIANEWIKQDKDNNEHPQKLGYNNLAALRRDFAGKYQKPCGLDKKNRERSETETPAILFMMTFGLFVEFDFFFRLGLESPRPK